MPLPREKKRIQKNSTPSSSHSRPGTHYSSGSFFSYVADSDKGRGIVREFSTHYFHTWISTYLLHCSVHKTLLFFISKQMQLLTSGVCWECVQTIYSPSLFFFQPSLLAEALQWKAPLLLPYQYQICIVPHLPHLFPISTYFSSVTFEIHTHFYILFPRNMQGNIRVQILKF